MEAETLLNIAGYCIGTAFAITALLCSYLFIQYMSFGKIFD